MSTGDARTSGADSVNDGSSPTAATVGRALQRAGELGLERLDAQLLLAHGTGRPRSWLIAHDDAVLDRAHADWFADACAHRAAGEPFAYLVGHREFHGLHLEVGPAVLIPRPDTELLVTWAIERLARCGPGSEPPRVVDLGTGSGAIALAVKAAQPRACVLATDASEPALAVARRNAARLRLDVAFSSGSWWAGLEGQRFDLVMSNPPYIAAGDPHLPPLRHEPQQALVSGSDGMDALREIVAGAAEHLAPGGWVLLEHGFDQADAVAALLRQHDFRHIETRRDLGGQPRCTGAAGPVHGITASRRSDGAALPRPVRSSYDETGCFAVPPAEPAPLSEPCRPMKEPAMRTMTCRLLTGVMTVAGGAALTAAVAAPSEQESTAAAATTSSGAAWSQWQGRLSLGGNARRTQAGPALVTATASDTRRSASLMGDYYFGRSLAGIGAAGGFRVTSGLIFGPRGLLATGQPSLAAGNSVSLGSALPRPAMLSASGEAAGDFSTLPYLGLGYTGLSARGGWSFSADLGLVGGSAGNTLRLGRGGYGQNLDDQVHELRSAPLVPLVQVGVTYAF